MLQISTVLTDGVSKSLCQKFFYARAAIVRAGKNIIFRYTDGYRDSAHWSQNKHDFPTFSYGLEFLNEAEKEKNNGKGTRHPRRQGSLHCPKDTLVKPNKLQTGLLQPLKVSLRFTVIKLLNINLELSTEKLK